MLNSATSIVARASVSGVVGAVLCLPSRVFQMEARASNLSPNFSEYKTPTLSYETHPNDLKFG